MPNPDEELIYSRAQIESLENRVIKAELLAEMAEKLFADLLQHAYGMEATIQKVNGNLTELADEYRATMQSTAPSNYWRLGLLEDFCDALDEIAKLMEQK